jgi:hypothetical protein
MKWLITLIAVLASSAAIAQDDGRDPNWFRKHIKNEWRSGSFRLPAQPQGEWYPGGTYYRLPDGTLRAVDDGWLAPPSWLAVGWYLPSRRLTYHNRIGYRWGYVRDAGKPGWPGAWSLVPDN